MKEAIIGSILFIAVIFFAFWISEYSCEQSWKDSGFASRWTIYTDCQIKVDGKWIPETAYREIQQ